MIKEGTQAGFRLKNGWQNSGQPWSPKMNADKDHRLGLRRVNAKKPLETRGFSALAETEGDSAPHKQGIDYIANQ